MTKLIEIGKNQNNQTKVPIVFDYVMDMPPPNAETFIKSDYIPSYFKYIELVCRDYFDCKDLMFAYDDPEVRSEGFLFVGNWNDGVID